MIQFFLVIISITYGYFSSLILSKVHNNLLFFFISIILTIIYIFITYKINYAQIDNLLKVSLIFGYYMSKKRKLRLKVSKKTL